MRIWRSWSGGRYYRKTLMVALVMACLPILFTGIGVQLIGTKQIESQQRATYQYRLQKSKEHMDDSLSHLETAVADWTVNPVFGSSLYDLADSYDYEQILTIFHALFTLKGSDPIIRQAYLYLGPNHTVYSEDEGAVQLNDAALRDKFDSLLNTPERAYWLDSFAELKDRSRGGPAFVYKLPLRTGRPVAALIVYVNTAMLNQMIDELIAGQQGAAVLMGRGGDWVSVGSSDESANAGLLAGLRTELLRQKQDSGTFEWRWGHDKYSVSYGSIERMGTAWKYAAAASLTQLLAPVNVVSRIMYAISGAGLLAEIVLLFVATRKLYQPVRRLIKLLRGDKHADAGSDELELIEKQWLHLHAESRLMKERWLRCLPALKEGFMLQLLQGHLYALDESDLRARLSQYEWDVAGKAFALLLIELAGASSFDSAGKFRAGDRQLVTFAAANIIEEIALTRFAQSAVINFQDYSVGVLIAVSSQEPRDRSKLELFRYAEELTQTLTRLLKVDAAVIVGKITPELAGIPKVLEEVRQVDRYRDRSGTNPIMDVEDHIQLGSHPVFYPFSLETRLIHSVHYGSEAETALLLKQFLRELQANAGNRFFYQQGLLQLLANIQCHFLRAGYNPYLLHKGADLNGQLLSFRETGEIAAWFERKILLPLREEMRRSTEAKEVQWSLLIPQVMEMIQQRYETDISLDSCAEALQVNPFTLSKSFKQVTGMNFIDYVTQVRLDRSKELLIHSDMKMNEIAESVGYQPSYFNRIFKKHDGMTPSEFRDKHRSHARGDGHGID